MTIRDTPIKRILCTMVAHILTFLLYISYLRPSFAFKLSYTPYPIRKYSSHLHNKKLPSAYDDDLPGGIVGEAVQSALRAPQCVIWKQVMGSIQVKGPGVVDFLNNKFPHTFSSGSRIETCLLNAKGQIVDRVSVGVVSAEEAWLIPAGHAATELWQQLDKTVFPLDQVELTLYDQPSVVLAGVKENFLERALQRWLQDLVPDIRLVEDGTCAAFEMTTNESLIQLATCGIPGLSGCTMIAPDIDAIWLALDGDEDDKENTERSLVCDQAEVENLRIIAGVPHYGYEYSSPNFQSLSPLEASIDIDTTKGCYLGQEGVAAQLNNPRGPPRSLYFISFPEDFNEVDGPPLPPVPAPLYVLGSNRSIVAGTLTSLATPGFSARPETVGLCALKRASSILTKMQEQGLDLPPSVDQNLEVVVDGDWVGFVKALPLQQLRPGEKLFVTEEENEAAALAAELDPNMSKAPDKKADDGPTPEQIQQAEAKAAKIEAEAQRKAEKMEMLKKRAEEAMARRKKAS